MKRCRFMRNSISFVWLVVLIGCLFVILISTLRLPQVQLISRPIGLYQTTKIQKASENENTIGKFGQMMMEMLPENLAFTVFIPSERAFKRDLRLWSNESLVGAEEEKMNDDSYAIVSRVLGFSAVPRTLVSDDVPLGKEVLYDSISGFVLYISKDLDGMLVVNRVRSQIVDIKKNEIVVHIMDGAVMDAEFKESVQLDDDDEHDQ